MQSLQHPSYQTVPVAPSPLSLAAISKESLPRVLSKFPALRQCGAWHQFWNAPVAELRRIGYARIWALAESPESAPLISGDSPTLDASDVLHLRADRYPGKHKVVDIADLSRHIVRWSDRRLAYWHKLANRDELSHGARQALIQWMAPLERRLRDELLMVVWRQSLQGEILPAPAFSTGHSMNLPLVRWITTPKSPAARSLRREMFRQAGGVVVLCLALVPSAKVRGQDALRLYAVN